MPSTVTIDRQDLKAAFKMWLDDCNERPEEYDPSRLQTETPEDVAESMSVVLFAFLHARLTPTP